MESTPLGEMNALAAGLTDLSVPRGLLAQRPPDAPARLGYLRNELLLTTTPGEIRDRVWRHVGLSARERGERQGDWNLFALGLAYPGLRTRAFLLTPPPVAFTEVKRVHFELSAEFLLALHRLSLDTPNVVNRLLGAAYDQASGRKAPRQPPWVDIATVTDAELYDPTGRNSPQPHTGPGEPRDVLNRLLRESNTPGHPGPTLTAEHAALIARTYLDGQMLYQVAADLGLSKDNASKRRKRGAGIVARLLGRPTLAED
jgi:hypothetical protein